MSPAPCGTLPPPHLAIDIPERVCPLNDFGEHTGGACVNVDTDVWSVLLLCIMAHFGSPTWTCTWLPGSLWTAL